MIEAWRSPYEMARSLVTYIPEAARVREEVMSAFGRTDLPELDQIRAMRQRHMERLRAPNKTAVDKCTADYERHCRDMQRGSALLRDAILAARGA